MGNIDPKVAAGGVGAAAATLLWILLATFVPAVAAMSAEALATVTGATATILAAILGYLVPNAASPVKGDGVGIESTIKEYAGQEE